MDRSGVRDLAIEHAHTLPPTARGQAQLEDLTIVTADPVFDQYDVLVPHATQA